ncbi:glycosyltransferase family 4 protein [Luteibacter pinisoli]|uniref:Glycosyltransferase family 4 protein n=1 Tax=Luteibacter pinisoli TaxID=2589080 RepID=A0A4Y5Z131_9GAMM|nr:glycosyltransferase family 4 protein [Luteibacter pinisoli]QDE38329.1 glycosyltransferase family 4 protein [Luteibacter pinisoli]
MKLGIILPGGVDRGGEERVIPVFLALIERLARAHDVHVFVFHQEARAARWTLRGAQIHNIGDGRTTARAVLAIRREHRVAPFDALQALFSGSCSLVAALAAVLIRVPYAVHIAGGELVALDDIDYGGRRRWRSRLREAVVLRAAASVTAASAPIMDALRDLGIPADRVPLGVDLDRWAPLAPRGRTRATLRLIHVASLNRVKDQSTLLMALALVAKQGIAFDVDIVGVDTLDGRIEGISRELGIDDRVRFLGFRTQAALRPFLAAADLLVMSSRHEAGPLVLLEAAVVGVPAVGTAVGHFAEWAPEATLAVPVGDAAALANGIIALANDEARRLRIATEAQRRALAEDADATARAFMAQYEAMTGAGRRLGQLA